jgi:hypothetical protein
MEPVFFQACLEENAVFLLRRPIRGYQLCQLRAKKYISNVFDQPAKEVPNVNSSKSGKPAE